jgi:hypothetical protein
MRKEIIIDHFGDIIAALFLGGMRKTTKNLSITGLWPKIRNQGLQKANLYTVIYHKEFSPDST